MADYEYLEESRIDETSTATYEFKGIRNAPTMVFAPANAANEPFWDALLAENMARQLAQKARKEGEQPSPAEEAAEKVWRAMRDCRLIARYCWRKTTVAPVRTIEERPDGHGGVKRVAILADAEAMTADDVRLFLENLWHRARIHYTAFMGWVTRLEPFMRFSFADAEVIAGNSEGG